MSEIPELPASKKTKKPRYRFTKVAKDRIEQFEHAAFSRVGVVMKHANRKDTVVVYNSGEVGQYKELTPTRTLVQRLFGWLVK